MLATIKFRGEEREVQFTNYGYEPDTNSQSIDWYFVDEDNNVVELEPELTDKEYADIFYQLSQIAYEDEGYDED